MTYAMAASFSMQTKTGKKLAVQQSENTVLYFKNLIADLSMYSILSLEIREEEFFLNEELNETSKW